MRKKIKLNPFMIACMTILILYTVIFIVLIAWGFMTSFKTRMDFRKNSYGLPDPWTFSNYPDVIDIFYKKIDSGREVYIPEMFFHSFMYAIGGAFFCALFTCITAYATAKFNFKLSSIIYNFVIIAMIVPIVGALPSEMNMIYDVLNIEDTYASVWFLKSHFIGMYYLVFYATFKSMPGSFTEAAEIDGASMLTVFVKIVFPMVVNIFGTIMLIKFIEFWNDYQTPMLYMPNKPVLAYGIYSFAFSSTGSISKLGTPGIIAGCMLLFVPIFIIFLVFNKKLMVNLTAGGLKE